MNDNKLTDEDARQRYLDNRHIARIVDRRTGRPNSVGLALLKKTASHNRDGIVTYRDFFRPAIHMLRTSQHDACDGWGWQPLVRDLDPKARFAKWSVHEQALRARSKRFGPDVLRTIVAQREVVDFYGRS